MTSQPLNILISSGAFKHCLDAKQVGVAITRGLERTVINAKFRNLPIADGGNGTLDAWLALGGKRITVSAHNPLMRPIETEYGILPDGKTAVIEMALISGIELISDNELNPMETTTYGTGELLKHALNQGISRIIIGMGGSATTDGGAGALQALGVELLDASGNSVPVGGKGLSQVQSIDTSNLDPRWQEIEIIIASDVDNPLLGDKGAAAVFGPQKGATPTMVNDLDKGLSHLFTLIAENYKDVRNVAGSGAAGGLSAGLLAFLNARIESGIDLLFQYNDFETYVKDADLVITGEGRMDSQTVHGKGPIGVARLAQQYDVPSVAFVGGLAVDDMILHEEGLSLVLPIVNQPMTLQDALKNGESLIEQTATRLGYILQLSEKLTKKDS